MLLSPSCNQAWGKAAAQALKASVTVKQRAAENKVINKLLADLKLCSLRRDLEWARRIHAEVVESGNSLDLHVSSALVNVYGKCGSMVNARNVFDGISDPNVVSWNALLLGYAENGQGRLTLDMFQRMKAHGCVPNYITYIATLKACTTFAMKEKRSESLEWGKRIHSEIGCHLNLKVQTTLIDMYAKCSSMVDAQRVFDNVSHPNVVSWNALLMGYAENGQGLLVLHLFRRMKALGCSPTYISYISVLKACASVAVREDRSGRAACLEMGKQIHSEIPCHLNLKVQTTLIDMYAKCGSMVDARRVFDSISHPNVVTWNTLVLGHADNGEGLLALDSFSSMKANGCAPDSRTYVGALKACGLLGALELGREIHSQISEFNAHVVSCLVDFYAKCGSMVEARKAFDLHRKTSDLSAWNALLAGYGGRGDTSSMFDLFGGMQEAGLQPDAVTFVCMLQCCSHAGLVGKAKEYFEAMPAKFGVTATLEHYTCMVDVLGRANKLDDALVMLWRMPCAPNLVTWMAVLSACRKWKNVEIATLAFQSLVSLNEKDAAAYILMAHIYGSRGMWEERQTVLEMQKRSHGWKVRDQAYVTGKVTQFPLGKTHQPEVEEKLKWLRHVMNIRESN